MNSSLHFILHQLYRQFFIFILSSSLSSSLFVLFTFQFISTYLTLFGVHVMHDILFAEGHAIFAYFSTYFVCLMNFVIFLITISVSGVLFFLLSYKIFLLSFHSQLNHFFLLFWFVLCMSR